MLALFLFLLRYYLRQEGSEDPPAPHRDPFEEYLQHRYEHPTRYFGMDEK